MREKRSPKVQRIVRLRGQAARLRASYRAGLMRLAPIHHKAVLLDQEACVVKSTLTDCVRELRRAWSGV